MKRSIKLSRLTDRQLKYLLRHGEIRFGDEQELSQKKKKFQQKAQILSRLYQELQDSFADLYWEIRTCKSQSSDEQLGNEFVLKKLFETVEKTKRSRQYGDVLKSKLDIQRDAR